MYREFLRLSNEKGERHPEVLDYVIKHGFDIIKDARNYTPDMEYKYMITFTVRSELRHMHNTIEEYILNLLKPMCFKLYYSKEHVKTNVHWHCVIHMTSRIVHSKFRYYKQKYGFVDISRSKDLSDENSIKYISKESEVIHVK